MSVKSIVKSTMPDGAVERLRRFKARRITNRNKKVDAKRFASSYATLTSSDVTQLESLLMFYVHQVEKGFSYDTYQYGRGQVALRRIAQLSQRMAQINPDWRNNPVYLEAVQAVGEYRRRHLLADMDVAFLSGIFSGMMLKDIEQKSEDKYSDIEILHAGKADNATVSFAELTQRRRAVRSYAEEPVSRVEIEKAVEMSLRTPSVCNRQPARVRIYTDKTLIEEALSIQGGFGGYDVPPALVLVTADLRAFIGANEHNEGYVDGGLFSMSLLYALEACDLAACPLNTMFGKETEMRTRRLLNIPDNEIFIMYIAVGHFKETFMVCLSKRFGLDHVLMN